MATYRLTSPDGGTYDITAPDGASPADVMSMLLSKTQPAPKSPAEMQVEKEHAESPTYYAVTDKLRQFARGTPVGSWTDEALAGISAAMGGKSYDEAKAYEDARSKYADEHSTKLGTLPLIGDVTTGGLTKLAGAVATLPFAPMPRGVSMLGTMGKSAVAGAGYGALYGAGEGNGFDERLKNTLSGLATGGGVGALVPPLARAAGNATGAVANALRPNPSELTGMSRTAIRNVLSDAEADGLFLPGRSNVGAQAVRLGDRAMLADMGRNLSEHAGGLATKPGISSEISGPLLARADGATTRLRSATDRAMGPPVSVPDLIDRLQDQKRAASKQLWDRLYQIPVKLSEDLHGIIDRAKAAGAMDQARKAMAVRGFDPNEVFYKGYQNSGVNNAALNMRFLDQLKRSIDGMAGAAKRSGDREQTQLYASLASDLRNEVDRILSPNNPAMSPWAVARKTAGDHLKLEDAFESGRKAFDKSLSYNQMLNDMRKMAPEERRFYRMGARTQLAEVADNAGTMFGSNGDAAMMRTLGTTAADRKVRQIAMSPTAGAALSRTRDAEAVFAGTERNLLQNSKTAVRTEQAKRYPLDSNDASIHNITFEGMIFGPAKAAVNILLNGALTAARVKAATDAARMLTAQGTRRDEIIRGLRNFQAQQAITGAQRRAAGQVINGLLTGARVNLIDARAAASPAMSQ